MTEIHAERRTFLQTAGGALALTAIATGAQAQAQSSPAAAPNRSPSMTFSPKPLPFDPQKVKGLSERILVSHYENNYGGAVKRLNSILEQLASLDYDKAPGFLINGLKREELIATIP